MGKGVKAVNQDYDFVGVKTVNVYSVPVEYRLLCKGDCFFCSFFTGSVPKGKTIFLYKIKYKIVKMRDCGKEIFFV